MPRCSRLAPCPPSGGRDVVIELHAAPDARAGAGGQRPVRVSHRRLSLTEHGPVRAAVRPGRTAPPFQFLTMDRRRRILRTANSVPYRTSAARPPWAPVSLLRRPLGGTDRAVAYTF